MLAAKGRGAGAESGSQRNESGSWGQESPAKLCWWTVRHYEPCRYIIKTIMVAGISSVSGAQGDRGREQGSEFFVTSYWAVNLAIISCWLKKSLHSTSPIFAPGHLAPLTELTPATIVDHMVYPDKMHNSVGILHSKFKWESGDAIDIVY